MIGNDIVDLKHSRSNWKRPRFLEKVFTENEHQLIFVAEDPHVALWLLWSMKEAAYKCHVQQFGARFFNPKSLSCQLISEANGLVKIDDNYYYTTSTITENYVYTIANLSRQKEAISSVFKTKNGSHSTQSRHLKAQVLTSIADTLSLNVQALSIEKTALGIPECYMNSERQPMAISLTHCGRFSGYAYALPTVNDVGVGNMMLDYIGTEV